MAEGLALEDTNMALFGTDIEKNLRYKNAENEPEWHKIPKEPCILIWRIEKFCVVPWPKNMYGTFYNGDSFIILHKITQYILFIVFKIPRSHLPLRRPSLHRYSDRQTAWDHVDPRPDRRDHEKRRRRGVS